MRRPGLTLPDWLKRYVAPNIARPFGSPYFEWVDELASREITVGTRMVVAAAREIHDGEVVFVGMRLPLLAFAVAKSTHAPGAVGLYENGVIRELPAEGLIYTMADGPNVSEATSLGDMLSVMGPLAAGRVDLGFLGAAQVDKFGNLNSTHVKASDDRVVRLPGSGGACDIACLAHRVVVLMKHEPTRLVERVDYITSPGWGEGTGWRDAQGLPRGGPSALITTRGVIRFDAPDREGRLAAYHPGETVEDIVAHTGWRLQVADGCGPTADPTPEERSAIDTYDPEGFWTG
jgi:glutaconate CoA-transferase subunit B